MGKIEKSNKSRMDKDIELKSKHGINISVVCK